MNNSSGGEYEYKNQGLLAIACMLLALFFAALTFAVISAPVKSSTTGVFILALGVLLFFGFAIVSLLYTSSVVVDHSCISRKIFGITWCGASWSEIGEIHVLPGFDESRKRRVRNIAFKISQSASIRRTSAVFFTDDELEKIDELICFINDRVKDNHIIIYSIQTEGKTKLPHL